MTFDPRSSSPARAIRIFDQETGRLPNLWPSAATLSAARPACAPSRLLQGLEKSTQPTYLSGVEQTDKSKALTCLRHFRIGNVRRAFRLWRFPHLSAQDLFHIQLVF